MLDIDGGLRERKALKSIYVMEDGGDGFGGDSPLSTSKTKRSRRSNRTRLLMFLGIGVLVFFGLLLVYYQSSDSTYSPDDITELEHDDHEHAQHPVVQHDHEPNPYKPHTEHDSQPPVHEHEEEEEHESEHQKETEHERHHDVNKEEHVHDHHGVETHRRDAVVKAFQHAWHAYEHDSWGSDDYFPLSHGGRNHTEGHGYGYMIVDALDTMILMNLTDEYERARQWVAKGLDFDIDGVYNVFETTIRVLGGLLSAYHLTNDTLYSIRATDLADRLMVAFDPGFTESGLPVTMVNLGKRLPIPDHANRGQVSISEVATLQLEFRYLSHITKNYKYWDAVENVMIVIDRAMGDSGLAPIMMNPHTGQFETSVIRLGSRGDSFYEYLLKQFLQTGGVEHRLWEMYERSMDAIHEKLIRRTPYFDILHTGELEIEHGSPDGRRFYPKQDHLVCFLGGSLMLGTTTHNGTHDDHDLRDWNTGVDLIEGCMETHKTATGLSPEIAHFRMKGEGRRESDWYARGGWDSRYSLRPETVESLFIAYRLTGDQRYRDWGWEIFEAIEKHCRIPIGGYASVVDVNQVPAKWDDKMESFFLSETLKYLFLLFEDSSVMPLDEVVFNTEAHPLPIFDPGFQTKLS